MIVNGKGKTHWENPIKTKSIKEEYRYIEKKLENKKYRIISQSMGKTNNEYIDTLQVETGEDEYMFQFILDFPPWNGMDDGLDAGEYFMKQIEE